MSVCDTIEATGLRLPTTLAQEIRGAVSEHLRISIRLFVTR